MNIGDVMVVTMQDRKIVGTYLNCSFDKYDQQNLHFLFNIGWIQSSDILALEPATESDLVLWKLENA